MTTEPITTDEHFGGCPICGRTDGYLNVGRGHWFVCDAHKARWYAGYNLFSSWQDETEAEQRARFASVEHYREATPVYPSPDAA